jgi:hypothetical protein
MEMARMPVREKPRNVLHEPVLRERGIELTEEDIERLLHSMSREREARTEQQR